MGCKWGQMNFIFHKVSCEADCVTRESVGCDGASGLLQITFKQNSKYI